MTVSAVIISHADRDQVEVTLEMLRSQTRPPEEVILTVCCMDVADLKADIVLLDRHRDDVGQSKCHFGITLATQDYVGLFSSDDSYAPHYLERMLAEDADIIHCDFQHVGAVMRSVPIIGRITRGCYLVRASVAKTVGYNHMVYEGDGLFIEDLKKHGASDVNVPEVLHFHR